MEMKLLPKDIDEYSEQELLIKASSETGPEAATKLFVQYSDLVYGLCLKYMGNAADAEDELMHVYELFLLKIKQHEVGNLKSWLYVLAKNHCLGILRKQKKEVEKLDQFSIMYSDQSFHPNNENQNQERSLKLENCIKKLAEMQQHCIKAFYYEKKSYDEISKELNISWNKMRSYIQNGRRNLKICLEK